MKKRTAGKSKTRARTGRTVVPPAVAQASDVEFEYALLRHNVRRFFDTLQTSCSGQPECGGILIGSYRGPHIEIIDCTEPGPADLTTRSSFTRRDEQHQEAATAAWHKSNHIATYVGEWHSHPLGQPRPSGIDRRVWRTVVAHLKTPCVFVIVSPAGWRLFRIPSRKYQSKTAPLVHREDGRVGMVFC